MGHQIKLKDLQEWLEDEPKILFASSTKDDKKLYMISGGFVVHKNGDVVHRCIQPFSAVEAYNNL